jgi:hypothetical protein
MSGCKINFEPVYRGEFKEDVTRYTKLPPTIMADESKEEKLLEKEKLKEWAGEFWEKKRAMKMNGSKSLELTD